MSCHSYNLAEKGQARCLTTELADCVDTSFQTNVLSLLWVVMQFEYIFCSCTAVNSALNKTTHRPPPRHRVLRERQPVFHPHSSMVMHSSSHLRTPSRLHVRYLRHLSSIATSAVCCFGLSIQRDPPTAFETPRTVSAATS